MSNENKKALLNEATTKRFWKLAGLKPIHEKAFVFGEEEEIEEATEETVEEEIEEATEELEEETVEEGGLDYAAEDDMAAEEPGLEDDLGAEEGPEEGQDVEVDIPEGDVASLQTARDILDQILSAVGGGEEELGAEEEPALDEPAPEEAPLDDEEAALQEVDQEELEEIAERIANRVAKRISESLVKKSK